MKGTLGEPSVPRNLCVLKQLKVAGARGSQDPAPPEDIWTGSCDEGRLRNLFFRV